MDAYVVRALQKFLETAIGCAERPVDIVGQLCALIVEDVCSKGRRTRSDLPPDLAKAQSADSRAIEGPETGDPSPIGGRCVPCVVNARSKADIVEAL